MAHLKNSIISRAPTQNVDIPNYEQFRQLFLFNLIYSLNLYVFVQVIIIVMIFSIPLSNQRGFL